MTLYRDLNFSGRSQSFTGDISDLRGSYVGNDAATSVRVSRGCRARLFADANYQGAYIETERDISDLRGSPVGNDTVTSIQVRCDTDGGGWNSGGGWGGGDSNWGTSHRVSLYQHTNFRGTAYSFDSDIRRSARRVRCQRRGELGASRPRLHGAPLSGPPVSGGVHRDQSRYRGSEGLSGG